MIEVRIEGYLSGTEGTCAILFPCLLATFLTPIISVYMSYLGRPIAIMGFAGRAPLEIFVSRVFYAYART